MQMEKKKKFTQMFEGGLTKRVFLLFGILVTREIQQAVIKYINLKFRTMLLIKGNLDWHEQTLILLFV